MGDFCSRANFDVMWMLTHTHLRETALKFQEGLRGAEPALHSRSLELLRLCKNQDDTSLSETPFEKNSPSMKAKVRGKAKAKGMAKAKGKTIAKAKSKPRSKS